MKMKSSMKLKAIMIITMLGMNLAGCAQAQKKDGTFAPESGMEIQVDSMVYKNESRPVYYARYGNRGCLFELRINDNISAEVTELWGIERSGFFNGREKWAKGFENQRV